MSPWLFLFILLLISAAALGWSSGGTIRRRRERADLARRGSMQFSATDRFGLTERIAERLACPGAAAVHVYDVMYCLRGDCHHYICTVEYTRGVIRTKRRRRVVARLIEPRRREEGPTVLKLASVAGARGYLELMPAAEKDADRAPDSGAEVRPGVTP